MKGKGLRQRLFYGVGFARTTGQGMNRNGRTQFAPTAGFASAEGWDTSRKRANTVRPYATQKKISTTQRTFLQRKKCLQRKRKFPACTVVHAGNPVIHRNPSITPFQGRVSGMGGRHPDKPPPHSHWATTGRKLPMQTRLTFPPVDKAETWSAHFRKLFLLRPRHSSTPNPPCNLSISIFRKHVMRRFIQWLRTCSFFGKQRMQTQAFRAPGRCGNRIRAGFTIPEAMATQGRMRAQLFPPTSEPRPFHVAHEKTSDFLCKTLKSPHTVLGRWRPPAACPTAVHPLEAQPACTRLCGKRLSGIITSPGCLGRWGVPRQTKAKPVARHW